MIIREKNRYIEKIYCMFFPLTKLQHTVKTADSNQGFPSSNRSKPVIF